MRFEDFLKTLGISFGKGLGRIDWHRHLCPDFVNQTLIGPSCLGSEKS